MHTVDLYIYYQLAAKKIDLIGRRLVFTLLASYNHLV